MNETNTHFTEMEFRASVMADYIYYRATRLNSQSALTYECLLHEMQHGLTMTDGVSWEDGNVKDNWFPEFVEPFTIQQLEELEGEELSEIEE